MASSDEDGEIVPDLVTDYHFADHKGEPISFSILPLHWKDDDTPEDPSQNVFLHGATDNALQKIHKKVTGWSFELSYTQPEIYVLSKGKNWIKLQKPRKCFEDTIRTVMITIQCLHFVKRNTGVSKDSLWNHLRRAFRSAMVEPSEKDLLEHVALIQKTVVADKDVGQSEYLAKFLDEIEMPEMPGKREALLEDNQISSKPKFVNDMDDCDDDSEDDDENEGLFDSVCAFCDNGGEVLVCEGVCIRSFHPTLDAGADTCCESLGFSNAAQYEAIHTFLCNNCQHEQHQCFVCGMLGSSNKSTGAEVFPCVSATCGHFYHPNCVAELLYPSDKNQAEELKLQILAGQSFTCPAHICAICKRGENKEESDLQFAVCRRCPKAYHRKCLPREIAFEDNDDNSIQQRAWDGLLPKRILIYCMDHKMIPRLGTPKRDHLLFPCVERKKNQQASGLQESKEKEITEKRSKKFGNLPETNFVRSSASNREKLQKLADKRKGTAQVSPSKLTKEKNAYAVPKHTSKCITMVKGNSLSASERVSNSSSMDKSKSSRGMHKSSLLNINSHLPKSKKQFSTVKTDERFPAKTSVEDTEMKKRILKLMEDSTASFDVEKFKEQQRRRCNSTIYSSRNPFDKTITIGKVEASMKAVRAALIKLEAGCSVEEAKVVCEPEVLKQLVRWKKKLKVYLAPFLYGPRYTSYGRHFTKVVKLKEIVNRLHWYVKDGDTIVDFCCGKNDFSCLLKEKLDEVGKRCSFKNYDILTPRNDFNFEARDWFTVGLGELPAGSNLIMGLNPPFGVQASLANQFINSALKFKPKLLILIVPKETKRLDTTKHAYDLVWEDDQILSGKSFYLPGSVDNHGQQLEDWNVDPPPLYLWSRPDFTAEHKRIAQRCGHLRLEQEENQLGVKRRVVSNYIMEETQDCYKDLPNIIGGYGDFSKILDDVPEEPVNENGTEDMEIESENPSNKMEIDKDLSASKPSQVISTDTQNIIGAKNNGDFMSPSDNHVRQGLQTIQSTSHSGHSLVQGSEYSYPSANYVYPPRASYDQSACPSQAYIPHFQPPLVTYCSSAYSSQPLIFPPATSLTYDPSAYLTEADIFSPGTLPTYGSSAYLSETDILSPGTLPAYGSSAYPSEPDIFPPGTLPTYGSSAYTSESDIFPPGTSTPGANNHPYMFSSGRGNGCQ